MSEERKKVVCLGMPSYGMTPGAARGFFRASRRDDLDVRLRVQESSLLAHNMNILWAWALNHSRDADGCAYFAMQHADVEPEDWWLDILLAEMDAKGLDVLGVAVPIKDTRGVTSIALARDDGDPWRVHCRLTMTEVYRLPETFTSDDVGRPLLLNTGLWVCRFDEAWARKVWFEVNDRIAWNESLGMYVPQVEPEDWFLSRLFHEQGLKVGCTRKVRLTHRGHMSFTNTKAWGAHSHDEEYLSESALPGSDAFPHDCAGWLTEAEGAELARLADGKNVLEIGSFCGRSTVCLARTAATVHAVDTFDGRGTACEGDTEATFRANLRKYGVADRVNVTRGESAEVLPNLPPVFDLAFVDGSHDYESVRRDARLAAACLRRGGLLAFHDYGNPNDPDVARAVGELVDAGAELLSVTETLAVVRPRAEILQPLGSLSHA